jgi:DNA gyrase subunit A
MKVIREELLAILAEYGDADGDAGSGSPGSKKSRRTEILEAEGEIEPIDLVADDPMVVMLTRNGYIKRLSSEEYRVQARGGKGVKGGGGRDDDDFVTSVFGASAHQFLLMFTDTGRVFRKRVFELPVGRRDSPGKAVVNFLDLRPDERVLEMVPYREEEVGEDHHIVTATAKGYVKRTRLSEYANIRTTGLIAVSIDEDDRLIAVRFTDSKQQLMMTSANGMTIRFDESDVRPMGRNARGVRGMGLRDNDRVVAMNTLAADSNVSVLTVSANGYGKRTLAGEYRVQSRAGLGLITIKVTERNGPVVGIVLVETEDDVMLVTSRGKVIRTPVAQISELGRNTQGVRIIKMGEGERVVAVARLVEDSDEGNASDEGDGTDEDDDPDLPGEDIDSGTEPESGDDTES